MSWVAKRLGNGFFGLVDVDDPDSPPKVSGSPVNKIVAVAPEDLASAGVYTVAYTPASGSAKIRRLIVSGTGLARVDVLYGTSGEQTLKWRLYTTLENLTAILEFKDYLPITSTQAFQVNTWNVTGSTQDYGITIEINE